MLVPRILEQIVGSFTVIPEERVSERTRPIPQERLQLHAVEQIVDVSDPQIMEEIVRATPTEETADGLKLILQGHGTQSTVEQLADRRASQAQEKLVEVIQLILQEQSLNASVLSSLHGSRRNSLK